MPEFFSLPQFYHVVVTEMKLVCLKSTCLTLKSIKFYFLCSLYISIIIVIITLSVVLDKNNYCQELNLETLITAEFTE